jgi:hypothetical protein
VKAKEEDLEPQGHPLCLSQLSRHFVFTMTAKKVLGSPSVSTLTNYVQSAAMPTCHEIHWKRVDEEINLLISNKRSEH